MNADIIKTILIDFIISQNDSVILGSEVTYGSKKKVVDIIELSNKKITAYEIKADQDDVRRLEDQIYEYKKIFDRVYIVSTSKLLDKIQGIIDNSIGILLIDDIGAISIIRKAILQREHDKESILATINADYLKRTFSINRKITANDTRKQLTVKSKKELKDALYYYLTIFLRNKYALFLSEKGINTHVDDIPILSIHRKGIIF